MIDYFTPQSQSKCEHALEEWIRQRAVPGIDNSLQVDKQLANNMFNKEALSEGDKYVLASMIMFWGELFISANESSRSFEEFLAMIFGPEWLANVVDNWIQKKNNIINPKEAES